MSHVKVHTVAVSVLTVTSEVAEEGGTALKLWVGSVDTSVDDVGAGTGTSSAVIGVGSATAALAGDTGKTPSSRGLGDIGLLLNLSKVGLDNGILLDVVNLCIVSISNPMLKLAGTYTGQVAEQVNNVISHVSRETTKTTEVVDMSGVLLEKLQSGVDEVLKVLVLHLDNVASWDGSASTGNDDWRRQGKSHWQKRDEK